jgi:hypothetical protein
LKNVAVRGYPGLYSPQFVAVAEPDLEDFLWFPEP